jgi:hypothetical protein
VKVGDLIMYMGTNGIYLVTWVGTKHFKLCEFGEELFLITGSGCEVTNESR